MVDRVLLRSGTALAPPGFMRAGELAYSPQDFRLWIGDNTGTAQPVFDATGAGGGSGLTSFQGRTTAAAVLISGDVTGALGFTPGTSSFDGAYASLTGKPTLFDGTYASLTGKPTLFDGTYASLTGRPTLATVATTGAYADLTGKPTLFDGTYASLTGKPTLGGAAALSVGTITGTVAAGDDSRITGALSATAAASTYAPLASPTFTTNATSPTFRASGNSALTTSLGTAFVWTDGTNQAVRQAGAFYVQNVAGTAGAAIVTGPASLGTDGTNYIAVGGNSTGLAPTLSAAGSDTNIDVNVVPKGTGVLKANGTAVLTTSTGLTKANNLSDLASPATARTNLGVAAFAWDVGFDQGAVVVAGTITVVRKASFACTITSLDYEVGSASGSFTVAVQIAGVSVTGLSAVAVSSATSANAVASGANTVTAGQAVTLVISSVTGSPTGANLQINGTR